MYAGVPIIAPVRVRWASSMSARPGESMGPDGSAAMLFRTKVACSPASAIGVLSARSTGARASPRRGLPPSPFSFNWRASPKSMTRT